MLLIIQGILSGIPAGVTYGLMGFSIALIFRTTGVMNFAIGHCGMLGVFVGWMTLGYTNSLILAILAGIVFGLILGALIERFLMRPINNMSHGGMLIITLGLLFIFTDAAMLLWGTEFYSFPPIYGGAPLIINTSAQPLLLAGNDIAIALVGLALSIILALVLGYTKIGIASRARAQDVIGAKVVGINTNRIDMIAWSVGIAIAVIVGFLVAPKESVQPGMLLNLLIFGLVACVLGGFGSPFGSIAGGLVLGVLEKIATVFVPVDYRLAIILFIVIAVLVLKPSGIFAKHIKTRA